MRWRAALAVHAPGHTLHTDLHITVNEDLSTRDSHAVAAAVEHALVHALPRLTSIAVHVDLCGHGGTDPHPQSAHHQHEQRAAAAASPAV